MIVPTYKNLYNCSSLYTQLPSCMKRTAKVLIVVMHMDVKVDTYQSHSEVKYQQHPHNIYCIFVNAYSSIQIPPPYIVQFVRYCSHNYYIYCIFV